MNLGQDFLDLLSLFNENGVRYLVAGGYATSVYAVPRYTKDLDIWLEPTEENAKAILAALNEFGFGSVGLNVEDFTKPDHVIQLGYAPNRIDLLTQLKGLDFETSFKNKNVFKLSEIDVSFISSSDLVKNKRAVARLQDLADVEQILARYPESDS